MEEPPLGRHPLHDVDALPAEVARLAAAPPAGVRRDATRGRDGGLLGAPGGRGRLGLGRQFRPWRLLGDDALLPKTLGQLGNLECRKFTIIVNPNR